MYSVMYNGVNKDKGYNEHSH